MMGTFTGHTPEAVATFMNAAPLLALAGERAEVIYLQKEDEDRAKGKPRQAPSDPWRPDRQMQSRYYDLQTG